MLLKYTIFLCSKNVFMKKTYMIINYKMKLKTKTVHFPKLVRNKLYQAISI